MHDARVLVAEDNIVNQVFIKEILEEMKCRSLIVSNGQEAVNAVQEHDDFDLILMDCLMPIMDGFQATREICALKENGAVNKNLPIIALTANAMKGHREECLQAGMDEYINKPVRKRALKETVYKWIKGDLPSSDKQHKTEPIAKAIDIKSDVLDFKAIETARDILKDKFKDMIDMYLENSLIYIGAIEKSYEGRITESLIHPAHTLKSTSKQMGATQLAQIAEKIEIMAKENVAIKDIISDYPLALIQQTFESTQIAFKNLRN